MKMPITLEVPKSTKAVHLAVTTANFSFESCDDPKAASLSQLTYEITKRDDSQLKDGQFECELRAILRTKDSTVKWCGYFVLEILCFG